MIPLDRQTVLVTGAAQGLGAAIARHLAGLGARLVLMDRNGDALARTVAQCPGAEGIAVDLSDAAATQAAIAKVTGPVTAVIHNAAILKVEPVDVVSLATFQATLNVGIQAAFQLTQAFWPGMKAQGGGALIFVSSRSGIEGFVDETAYCAAKHALEGFSKCLAMEGAAHDIASYTITPGHLMHTPMSETTYGPEQRAKWIDPIRLAPAFAMLVRDRPMHLSGQRLDAWHLSQPEATQ